MHPQFPSLPTSTSIDLLFEHSLSQYLLGKAPATLAHMFWFCPTLHGYWTDIFEAMLKVETAIEPFKRFNHSIQGSFEFHH